MITREREREIRREIETQRENRGRNGMGGNIAGRERK